MKVLIKLLILLTLGAVICLPGMAVADWTSVDQGWYDNYPLANAPAVNLDRIDFYITDGTAFGSGGVVEYGSPGFSGWTITNLSATHIVATNASAPTSGTWMYQLADPGPAANWTLIWNGFYQGNFVLGETDNVINGACDFGPSGNGVYFSDTPYTPVPLPPTLLLLGTGLLGLIGLRRKPRRGNSDDSIK